MEICAWWMWKWSNGCIFRHNCLPTESKPLLLLHYFQEHVFVKERDSSGLTNPRRREEIMIVWTPPPRSMVKLNIDGASRGNPGSAGCGCVIRNHQGHWVIDAAQNLGMCTAYQAELWAVLVGIRLAWNSGFRRVILETDSTAVHHILMKVCPDGAKLNVLAAECRLMLDFEWMVEIRRVYREANFVVDGWRIGLLDRYVLHTLCLLI